MASASSASQSTLSTSRVSTVSQSTPSAAAPTVGPPASSSTAPRPTSSTPVVPTPTTPASSSTSSTHSGSSTSSHPAQTTVFVAQTPSDSQNHGSSSIAVVVPIVAVAGILIIIYLAYRIYLLHKRRKDEKVPLPPPRVPAIFERPQSVMYANPPTMLGGSPPPSYRQSMRPVSMLYNPGSSSSSLPTKGAQTSASGHTTPTQVGFPVDENGRQSPMLFPQDRSMRGGMPPRPHSVASFGSNRYSSYGTPRTPYMNRVEVVLPQPLAGGSALSSASARQSRFSTYNGTPNPEMRPHSMILPPLAVTREGDWATRVTTTAEERASSSMDHSTTPAPPPPPKDRPRSAFILGETSSAGTSRDHAMMTTTGAFPPSSSTTARPVSPPEPLLASGVFASSVSDSMSAESHEAAKPTKTK